MISGEISFGIQIVDLPRHVLQISAGRHEAYLSFFWPAPQLPKAPCLGICMTLRYPYAIMKTVLVVCTANICRSPLVAALLEDRLAPPAWPIR